MYTVNTIFNNINIRRKMKRLSRNEYFERVN